ncbi:MAG: glycosyltransferase [Chloroflexota bacterium]|nr:glycosyltransferase [Chloroflexota bacterium]
MRIAVVAPLSAPTTDATSRGSHVIVADLARGLKARGHEVMVFCAQGSYLKGIDTAPIIVDARASAYDEMQWHVHQWDPDVVSQHAFDPDAFSASHAHPVIHTLHANPGDPASAHCAETTGAPLVAVSRDSCARWRQAGAQSVSAIANGVPDFPVAGTDPEPIALIAGRVAPEKGTAVAIRAAKRAGLEPVVVGEVCDRGYFAREVVPLLDRVRVLRTLPRTRVFALMERAAVTLMPVEWDEPFGLVAAEAQLAGCPVVGYDRGALSEVVHHGEGGMLVSGGDEDALVSAMQIARSMRRSAIRGQAIERFDFDLMLDGYEERLAEAATGMPRRLAA